MPVTSTLGPGQQVAGTLLQIDTGASPDVFVTIANVTDLAFPTLAETNDVTNVGNTWRARLPALNDMGKIAFKIFWMMADPTHDNVARGLRALLINHTAVIFQVAYPDLAASKDIIPGYVTMFSITGKVGGVYTASIEIANSGAPTLC